MLMGDLKRSESVYTGFSIFAGKKKCFARKRGSMRRWKRYKRSLEKAKNFGTSPEHLSDLANHPWLPVRRYVASNPNARPKTLELLATDKDFEVKENVSKNLSTPSYVLHSMAVSAMNVLKPDIPYIEAEVKRKYVEAEDDGFGISEEETAALMELELLVTTSDAEDSYEKYAAFRHGIVSNPNVDVKTLELLATDSDENVRRAVADNPKTPLEVALLLNPSIKRD